MIATRARTEPYLATKRVDLGSKTSRGRNVSFLRAERVRKKVKEEEGGGDAPERYSERPQHASRSKVDSDQAHEQRRLGFEEIEYGSVRVALSTVLERAEEVGCVWC